jgi:beta-galactosidase
MKRLCWSRHFIGRGNCDHLKFYIKDKLIAEVDPDRVQFQHLRYAPFIAEVGNSLEPWGDLRIEGYIQGKQVIAKSYSGKGFDQKFSIVADDQSLFGDGADTTRVVLAVTDEYGAICPFANDAIKFEIEGPAYIIGDNPFALVGGTGAIWVRAKEEAGQVRLRATHPHLGKQEIQITIAPSAPEAA